MAEHASFRLSSAEWFPGPGMVPLPGILWMPKPLSGAVFPGGQHFQLAMEASGSGLGLKLRCCWDRLGAGSSCGRPQENSQGMTLEGLRRTRRERRRGLLGGSQPSLHRTGCRVAKRLVMMVSAGLSPKGVGTLSAREKSRTVSSADLHFRPLYISTVTNQVSRCPVFPIQLLYQPWRCRDRQWGKKCP